MKRKRFTEEQIMHELGAKTSNLCRSEQTSGTTRKYGPDAYAFARDKPISLVDGPNLIAMQRKHSRQYKIDLEEAR